MIICLFWLETYTRTQVNHRLIFTQSTFSACCSFKDIRVIVIAVGDFTTEYVDCICEDADDWIPVDDFSDDNFNSIMGSLSDVVCPVTKEAKVTEVKAEKKQSTWNKRWGRFVEIYNSGVEFNVNDIALSGLVDMTHGDGPDVNVSQGQYLVFYDAADEDTDDGDSTVTCHLCDDTCDLDECGTDAGDTSYTGECWCENAVYIACSNTAESCAYPLNTGNSDSAIDGCSACTFDDSMVCV